MEQSVFFSYSRNDQNFVDKVSRDLESLGIDTWVDRGDIVAGGAWREQIVAAIKACQIFIIVLSPNSMGSGNVNRELTLAERDGKTIIPILLKNVEIPDSMAYQLAGLQHVDFSAGSYEQNLKKLLSAPAIIALRKEKSGEGVPPSTGISTDRSTWNKKLGPLPIWGWGGAGVVVVLVVIFGVRGIFGRGGTPTTTPDLTAVAVLPAQTSTQTPQLSATIQQTETKEPTITATEAAPVIENTVTDTPVLFTSTPIPTISTSIKVQRGDSTAEMVLIADCLFDDVGNYDEANCDLTLDGNGLGGAFYMDVVPVTNEQFVEFLNQNSFSTGDVRNWFNFDHQNGGIAINSSGEWYRKESYENYPVIAVSWDWAEKFCSYYGGDLPSEQDWIMAARGNGNFLYPWGTDQINPSYANYNNRNDKPIPVKSNAKNVSPFGVWDMAGNVWEWTNTYINEDFVLKGGSYISNDFLLRIDQRKIESPDVLSGDFGFRCMCSPADACYSTLAVTPTPSP